MNVTRFDDGLVIHGDSTSATVAEFVKSEVGLVPLIIADPPYGNVVKEEWDKVKVTDDQFSDWMIEWTRLWSTLLYPSAAFYVWGGIGQVAFRPFFKYLTKVEKPRQFEIANLITWKKRRAYGVQNNYLFTREECAYMCNGNAKKPYVFNIPLLDEKRGYAGFNKKYPAKSEFFRRSNVWTDINEIMHGKLHPTEKTQRLYEVIIETHTNQGHYVIDPFAGGGTTAMACRKLGRKFVVIDESERFCSDIVNRLSAQ